MGHSWSEVKALSVQKPSMLYLAVLGSQVGPGLNMDLYIRKVLCSKA